MSMATQWQCCHGIVNIFKKSYNLNYNNLFQSPVNSTFHGKMRVPSLLLLLQILVLVIPIPLSIYKSLIFICLQEKENRISHWVSLLHPSKLNIFYSNKHSLQNHNKYIDAIIFGRPNSAVKAVLYIICQCLRLTGFLESKNPEKWEDSIGIPAN